MKKVVLGFIMVLLTLLVAPAGSAQNVSIWNGSSEIWTQGQGTQSSPYLIENAQQLAYIAEMVNGGVTHYDGTYFKLTTDVYIDSITVWQPIGNASYFFGGHFDGDNHTVTLYLTNSMAYVGIFGYAKNGSFQNLTSAGRVTRISASPYAYAGGICGYSTSPFTNCHNTGAVSSSSNYNYYSYSGGICGYSTAAVTNCHNTGAVSSSSSSTASYSGGICGYSTAAVTNCHNTGDVFSSSSWTYPSYSGGICGYSTAAVTNCHNTGTVSSSSSSHSSYSGGICGYSTAYVGHCHNIATINSSSTTTSSSEYSRSGGICGCSTSTITNCYNTGDISSVKSNNAFAGGICGNNSNIGVSIKNCYNVGSLISGTNKSGICAYSVSITITNCHYLNTCGHNNGNGSAKTEAQMKSSSFPVILNTDSVVFVMDITPNINQGYPVFGSVSTQDATNVGATTATFNGRYQMLYDVDAHGFEYKTSSESNYTMVNSTGDSPVSYNISGLLGGTAYTYRFFVQKDGVIYRGADKTFTTAVCSLAVQVTATPAKLCAGDTVTYTAVPTGGTGCQYSWNTGSQNSSISITNDDTYTVTVTDDLGCQVTASKQLTLYPAAVASISGSTVLCNDGSTTLTANGGTTYLWSTGSSQRTITVNQPGTYVTTVTTVYGCSASDSVVVVPFANPSILGEATFCSGGYTTLTATGGDSYQWSTGATSASINVNTAGNYSVTASTSNGCSGSASVTVIQNQASDVTISGNTVICSGVGTSLTASSGTDYLWSTGETTQSITISNPGTYSVTVTNSNGCSNFAAQTVSMMEQVTISGNGHICSGQSTTLTASGSGSYAWSTGANTPSITVSTPGNYTVTVTLPNGCSSSAAMNVTVGTAPTPVILGNTTLCQGQSTSLSANGGVSYLWNNGSTNSNISVSQSGIYTVTATNAEGCSAPASVTVTVNPLPNVNIIGNSGFCQGGSITLTATGASTYSWSNGSSNATITVSNPGNYTVIGTDANNCTNTAAKTVSVNPTYNIPIMHSICQGESYNFNGQYLTTAGTYTQNLSTVNGCDSIVTLTLTVKNLPTPVILGNTTLCQGQSTTLSVNGGISYAWSNGSTNNNISVSQSGIYNVTATNAEGCSAPASVTVTVNPLPSVNISGNNSFCQGDNVTLTATGANTYAWSNASSNAVITVGTAGTYTVTGTDANGCSNTATKTVSVNPTYNIPLTHSICQGESYNFYGQNLTTAGTYMHTLQTVNGCDSVLTLTLTVKTLPSPTITGNTSLCEGETTTLTANGGVSYVWDNASTSNSISVSQSGVYTVTATNAEGCSAPASVTVTVNPLPTITIAGNTTFCAGNSTTLTATGADSYTWSTGDNTASVSISAFGIYTVTGTSTVGCSGTAEVTVLVSQLPVISISGETDICAGESTTLTANGGETYLWSDGTTSNTLTVSMAGTYQVIGYNAAGCYSIADATVNVWQPNTSEFSIECPDSCYIWNGESYCQSGDYTQTLQTAHGCDSVVTLHLTITVGIEDHNLCASMTVYPNPTNGVVNVQCTMNNVQVEAMEIRLYDAYGKLVNVVAANNDGTTQIDLSRFAPGVYFVKAVADGNVVSVRKVVKR